MWSFCVTPLLSIFEYKQYFINLNWYILTDHWSTWWIIWKITLCSKSKWPSAWGGPLFPTRQSKAIPKPKGKEISNTLTSIFLAVYLIPSIHAKTGKLLCEVLYKSLVRPSLWAKNLQQKHVCLHMRVSSPANLCNCSCPAVHAGLQRVHMSRPTFVWLVLKQWVAWLSGWLYCYKQRHQRGNTKNKEYFAVLKCGRKFEMIKQGFRVLKMELG